MTKQLLIYESAVPLSASRHAKLSLDTTANYAFSAGVNAVPLMAIATRIILPRFLRW